MYVWMDGLMDGWMDGWMDVVNLQTCTLSPFDGSSVRL